MLVELPMQNWEQLNQIDKNIKIHHSFIKFVSSFKIIGSETQSFICLQLTETEPVQISKQALPSFLPK